MRSVPWLVSITLHTLLILAIIQVSRPLSRPSRPLLLDFRILAAQTSLPVTETTTRQPQPRKVQQRPVQKQNRATITKTVKSEHFKAEDATVRHTDRRRVDLTGPAIADSDVAPHSLQPQPKVTSAVQSAAIQEDRALPDKDTDVARQRRLIGQARRQVLGELVYPALARRNGWCGQLVLGFVWCSDGSVEELRVVESSGYGLLDRAAIRAVKAAVPFDQGHPRIEVRLPINFELK